MIRKQEQNATKRKKKQKSYRSSSPWLIESITLRTKIIFKIFHCCLQTEIKHAQKKKTLSGRNTTAHCRLPVPPAPPPPRPLPVVQQMTVGRGVKYRWCSSAPRCRRGRSGSACSWPATGPRNPCGINACTEGAWRKKKINLVWARNCPLIRSQNRKPTWHPPAE